MFESLENLGIAYAPGESQVRIALYSDDPGQTSCNRQHSPPRHALADPDPAHSDSQPSRMHSHGLVRRQEQVGDFGDRPNLGHRHLNLEASIITGFHLTLDFL